MKYNGHDLSDAEIDEALAKMSCLDLLSLIIENTSLQLFCRKGVIVLLYHGRLPYPGEKDPFAPKTD